MIFIVNFLNHYGRFCFLTPILLYFFVSKKQARSSMGERFLDAEEAGGSIPPVPTLKFVCERNLMHFERERSRFD